MIPIGTGVVGKLISTRFTSSAFLIITVHMLAPMRSKRLPAIEKIVETKNVRLFLRIPLIEKNYQRGDQPRKCNEQVTLAMPLQRRQLQEVASNMPLWWTVRDNLSSESWYLRQELR